MTTPTDHHFNRPPKRNAEFFTPPNLLKNKVGIGGLPEDILDKAQALLESNTVDFRPLGEAYLESLEQGVKQAKNPPEKLDTETIISHMLFPAMQLKANGGMFHYDLITAIADKLVQFLEVIDTADKDALHIVMAFHTTMKAILLSQMTGMGGDRGHDLHNALIDACHRYFEKKT